MPVLTYGDRASREVSQRIDTPYANITALAVTNGARAADGMMAVTKDTLKRWVFSSASALTADSQLVVGAGSGTGRWLLCPGSVDLSFPITFATADAAVLYTVPTGALLRIARCYWEVTVSWTGGASSAIGLSSSQTVGVDHSTKGDIHGGAAGDVAAALTSTIGISEGTVGADIAAGVILRAGSTIRFDRVTSAFTAGTGNVHVVADLLKNTGA